MKQLTHAASGILLASLALHYTSHSTLCVLCWAVTWSIISDFDVYVPTLEHRAITHTLAFALFSVLRFTCLACCDPAPGARFADPKRCAALDAI
jgi:membrane-bound metal-dependent hydrolase YbcI (DUF457 family)